MTLNYLKGDATNPRAKKTILAHGCNSGGGWGSGFVLAVNKLSPLPQNEYRKWYQETVCYACNEDCIVNPPESAGIRPYEIPFMLGEIQLVKVRAGLAVANMITQKNTGMFGHLIPLRYDSLRECFYRLSLACKKLKVMHVTMPKIGCGLACGDWKVVEQLVQEELVNKGVEVDVYEPA
jgi:O-acetyl-ADP-ribose deacetylase (regulator of RNase III)